MEWQIQGYGVGMGNSFYKYSELIDYCGHSGTTMPCFVPGTSLSVGSGTKTVDSVPQSTKKHARAILNTFRLEAQLLSTKQTILEISESLGVSSQSFFGKYFKRVKGVSPKEYRAKD